MLAAKIMLISESPMEGIGGKRQQQLFPNLCYDQNHQMVNFKNSVQGLNLNLSRNYSQEILFKQPKWFWWPAKVETSEVGMGVGWGQSRSLQRVLEFNIWFLLFTLHFFQLSHPSYFSNGE